uniref:NADH-ubiquinone oxidoreductase chain 3 n=1 Tax=Ophiura sarsii TaxID=861515 RepID=A0A5J6BW99_9ECHI|nr:NADH dehydrogenase subunit 3 [Ophiura sarsii]QEP94704.1 NADH dehydrogenase subunit 3 [Ophiura sarsii]QHT54201.1 NADH dehydrogenase subunit 3 [Ophiura sarsii]QYF07887.1 NADH dehydrogenase subunit 3 [Ophiura sarsii]
MLPTTTFILISIIITSLLFFVGQVLPQQSLDLQKSSPYECGFDPINSSRLPFSFRFFLVALLFLLFDLEIAILLPLPISTLLVNSSAIIFPLIIFLLVLTAGLIYEWINGGLDWANN